MVKVRIGIAALIVWMCFSATGHAAPNLLINGGTLFGATGVTVGSNLYDVNFVDGTCASAFGACDAAHFLFADSAEATLAGLALLNSVFLDSAQGLFDSIPVLTNGCPGVFTVSEGGTCVVLTPYGTPSATSVPGILTFNRDMHGGDAVFPSGIDPLFDFASIPDFGVWAVWQKPTSTPQNSAIPEISSWISLPLGIFAVAWVRRRLRYQSEL